MTISVTQAYTQGHEAVTRHRATPTADVEDACVHLLMLHLPWRSDCDQWLQESGHPSFFALAEHLMKQTPANHAIFDRIAPLFHLEGPEHDQETLLDKECERLLTPEQKILLATISQPGLHLVEGVAGTGKSTVLRALRGRLRDGGMYEAVVLAPSGVAAVNVGGWTIHSYFGAIPVGGGQQDMFVPNLFNLDWNLHAMKNRGRLPYFVLDEFSMLSASTLDGISKALAKVLTSPDQSLRPFGGAPVCAFGDFGQLGPIVKIPKNQTQKDEGGESSGPSHRRHPDDHREWAFFSDSYQHFQRHRLHSPIRQQQGDPFFRFLSIIRSGYQDQMELDFVRNVLQSRQLDRIASVDQGQLTVLSSLKTSAHETNERYVLRAIDCFERIGLQRQMRGVVTMEAMDNVEYNVTVHDSENDYLERETGLARKIDLWVGARMMVTMNLAPDQGIINGAIGHVVSITPSQIGIKLPDNNVYAIAPQTRESSAGGHARLQFPMRLAYGLTIHKCQSLTLDSVVVDLAGIFCSGQAYVALSRVKKLDHLYVTNVPQDLESLFPIEMLRSYL